MFHLSAHSLYGGNIYQINGHFIFTQQRVVLLYIVEFAISDYAGIFCSGFWDPQGQKSLLRPEPTSTCDLYRSYFVFLANTNLIVAK